MHVKYYLKLNLFFYSPGLWGCGGCSGLNPSMDVTPPPTGEIPPIPGRNAWFIHMCRESGKKGAAAAWCAAKGCREYMRGGVDPNGPPWLIPPDGELVSLWLLRPSSSWIPKGLRWGSVGAVRAVMWAWAACSEGDTCSPPLSMVLGKKGNEVGLSEGVVSKINLNPSFK